MIYVIGIIFWLWVGLLTAAICKIIAPDYINKKAWIVLTLFGGGSFIAFTIFILLSMLLGDKE